MTTTLVHTGMRVPTDRIRVTSLKQLPVGGGVAWSAVLRHGKTKLGDIHNDGQGGDSRFHAQNTQTKLVLADFVAQCRDHRGHPMTELAVLEGLTDEYELTRTVTDMERRHAYAVRYVDHADIPGLYSFTLGHAAPPNYEPALRTSAYLDLPENAVRAQLWMGERGWVEFLRTDQTPE